MFEYLGQCPKCNHHLIVSSTRAIKRDVTKKLPQRVTKCANCRTVDPKTRRTTASATVRATIIGSIVKLTRTQYMPTNKDNAEFSKLNGTVNPEYATGNALRIQLWK